MKIKSPSDLKWHVEQAGDEPFFFTRETMRFWGDSMKNYGLRSNVTVETRNGPVACFELYRKRPVKHGLDSSAFFNAQTFTRVFPA